MSYRIKKRSFERAKRLGVIIKPSKLKGKKIRVLDTDGNKIADIGARGYKDYPTYLELEKKGRVPPGTADKKKRQYKARHKKNRLILESPGYYADQILWS